MNRVVSSMTRKNQELEIGGIGCPMDNVFFDQRIHMVNYWSIKNRMFRHTEVAARITGKDVTPNMPPFPRSVKLLVDPPVETESFTADYTTNRKISESLDEGG